MRTEAEFIAAYAESHQSHTNQIVHMVCVPVIFVSTIALMWLVPIGRFIPGVPADVAPWINLATVAAIPMLVIYAKLSAHALLVGGAWLIVSLLLTIAGVMAGWPLGWIAAAAWIAAWAVQFWGHKVEGAKPSFADDLVFLLIGPLFVQKKLTNSMRSDQSGNSALTIDESLVSVSIVERLAWHTQTETYENFPLLLRYPVGNVNVLQSSLPTLLTITHTFSERQPSGLPATPYNSSLKDLDRALIKLFQENGLGTTVLVETYAGDRAYYKYISTKVDLQKVKADFAKKFPGEQLAWTTKPDAEWTFLANYRLQFGLRGSER